MTAPVTILAVDDTIETLELIRATLALAGFNVRPADSGELALAALAAGLPDLILLDLRMPGIGGLEVCRRVKADPRTRAIPVILMSAHAEAHEWIEGLQLGAADYLLKPFRPEELVHRVRTQADLLRAQSQRRQLNELKSTNVGLAEDLDAARRARDELRAHLGRAEQMRLAMLSVLEDQRQAETALRESEAFRQRLFESSSVPIVVMDPGTQAIVDCNPAAAAIYGFASPAEAIGKTPGDASAPEQYDGTPSGVQARRFIERALGEGKIVFEWRHRRPSGEIWDAEVNLMTFDAGHRKLVQFTLQDITERKRAEESLRRTQDRLELAQRAAGAGIWDWDIPTGRLEWSPEMFAMFGLDPARDPAALDLWERILHPDDRPAATARLEAAIRDATLLESDYRIIRPDGAERWIYAAGRTTYDSNGRPLRMAGICLDTTNRKAAEQALHRSEALFRRTFDEAPVGSAIVGLDWKYQRVNAAFCHFLGYSAEELIGKTFADITPPEDLPAATEGSRRLTDGEIPTLDLEKRYRRKDGRIVWGRVSLSLVRDAAGRPLYLLPIVQNIDQRKRAEAALRESERRYATTLAAVNDGLWEWNVPDGTAYFSPLYYTMLGYANGAFAANYANWRRLVHPDDIDRVELELLTHVDTGTAFAIDLRMQTGAGAWQWVSTRGSAVERDAAGRGLRMVGTLSDITARKRAEHDLQQFFELVPDMVCIATGDGFFRSLNDQWTRVLGYSKAELMAVPYADFVHPDDLAATAHTAAHQRSGRGAASFVNRYRAKDGTYRWLEWNATPANEAGLIFAAARDITEHRVAEEALRESEVRFRTLADSGQALIWTSGLDKKCNYFNQPWLDFTGRRLEQELGDGWTKGVHPEDFDRCVATYVAAFERREKFSMDYRIRHRDGAYRWIQDNGSPRFDSHGGFLGYIGHCLDITDRKLSEQALQESEEKFARAFRSAPVMTAITDLETGLYLDMNEEVLRVSGFTREEMLGHSAVEIGWLSADQRSHLANEIRAHGKVSGLEVVLRTKAGEPRNAWVSGEEIVIGGRPRLLTVTVDVTERKRAEEERRQSHELLAKLAAQVPGVVYQYRLFPDGRSCFPYASPGMRVIYEYDPEDVRLDATPVFGRLHPEDAGFVAAAIHESARTLAPFHCEFRVVLPRQGLRWRLSDATPERTADGGTLWYGIISDITERRVAEEALRASLREKEALLKEVHHRVKNNLQIISSLLRLQSGQTDNPATTGVLHDMQDRIRSMALLHETLYRSGDLARVNLADYLDAVCTQLLRAHQRSAGAIDLRLALAPVELDATQAVPCGLLVNELVSNALKHAFPAGRPGLVHVALEILPAAPASAPALGRPQLSARVKLRLAVTDNGVGLPAGLDVKHLHSLGLQLVSDLARQLQGDLTFGPGAEGGAAFALVFAPQGANPPPAPPLPS